MPDPLMAIVDDLVADLAPKFAAVTIAGTTYPITIAWPHTPCEDLDRDELRSPRLWVIDASDMSVPQPGGSHANDYGVLFVLQMAIPRVGDEETIHRALSSVMADLKELLRPLDPDSTYAIDLPTGSVFCLKAERSAAKNHDDWRHRRVYYAELMTTWRMY
jgi:hypothetical protein